MKKYSLFALIGISCCWISCNENQQSSSQGEAIVLGDSSTIVTETDSAYLQEVVADFKEPVPETGLEPEAPAPKADTAKTIQEITKATLPEIKGFLLDFGTASAVFANIETREFRKQNPATSDGLSYAITSGKLSQLQVSGVKELKVRQRYQSALLIKGRKGTLELPGYYTSTWETLNGKQSGDQFNFSLPGLNKPDFIAWNAAKIRKEAESALKKKRTSSANMKIWRQDLKKVRRVQSAPCEIELKNVQYQISGTDSKGKAFFKTIRLDA